METSNILLLGLAGVAGYLLLSNSAEAQPINLGGGGSMGDNSNTTPDTTYVFNVQAPTLPSNSSQNPTSNTKKEATLDPVMYSQSMAKDLIASGVQNGSFYNASTGGYQNFVNGQGSSSKDPLPTKKAVTTAPTAQLPIPNTYNYVTQTGTDARGQGYSSATDLSKKEQKATPSTSNPFTNKVF